MSGSRGGSHRGDRASEYPDVVQAVTALLRAIRSIDLVEMNMTSEVLAAQKSLYAQWVEQLERLRNIFRKMTKDYHRVKVIPLADILSFLSLPSDSVPMFLPKQLGTLRWNVLAAIKAAYWDLRDRQKLDQDTSDPDLSSAASAYLDSFYETIFNDEEKNRAQTRNSAASLKPLSEIAQTFRASQQKSIKAWSEKQVGRGQKSEGSAAETINQESAGPSNFSGSQDGGSGGTGGSDSQQTL